VMYLGRLVEIGKPEEVLGRPRHPYTQVLLASVPSLSSPHRQVPLQGDIPSPINPPHGCRFHTRCPLAFERCGVEEPQELNLSESHRVWCHLAEAEVKEIPPDVS
jgi:oligopeptide/dipeptide ABC transporter ATP-binding protein